MKALEFLGQIDANNAIEVPPEVAAQLQRGQAIRVIVLMPDTTDDMDWSRLTMDQFLSGYSEGDAIYDNLPAG
jgi:hypothetical protein